MTAPALTEAAVQGGTVPSTPDAMHALNDLGITLFEAGHHERARVVYARALDIAASLGPEHAAAHDTLLGNLGQAEHRLGDLTRARELLERSVAMRERRVPDSVDLAVSLDNLGAVCTQLGELARAEAAHRRAGAIFRREHGPADPHLAISIGNLGAVYAARGDREGALACRLRALDMHVRRAGFGSAEALTELHWLVTLYLDAGERERADRALTWLLEGAGTTARHEHRIVADLLFRLGRKLFRAFHLDLAERLLVRAVEFLEAIDGPAAEATLDAVHLLGHVQRAVRDLEGADRSYRRALHGYTALGRQRDAARVALDLAKVFRDRGGHQAAAALMEQVLADLRNDERPDPVALASALGNLAMLHHESGAHAAADAAFREALRVSEGSPNETQRAWLVHGRALLAYHVGRHDQALALHDEADRRWTDALGADHPFATQAAWNVALVHWARGDTEAALATFARAAARQDVEMRRILAVGSERKRMAYAQQLLGDLFKVASFHFAVAPHAQAGRLAAELTLQRKGRVLDAVAHSLAGMRARLGDDDRALLDRLVAVRAEIVSRDTGLSSRDGDAAPSHVARLRAEEERLEAEMSYRAALVDPDLAPVGIADVQRALPADGALIEFLRFPVFDPVRTGESECWRAERYAALVVRPTGEPRWFDLGPAAVVDERVEALRRVLRRRKSPLAECAREASALHALVLAPLADALAGATRLVIAPDGRLTLVPFGVLTDAQGQRLSTRAVVSYAAAGRELALAPSDATPARDVVVVADPDYAAETTAPSIADDAFGDRGTFAPLPGARAEGEDIRSLLTHVTVMTGAAATVDAVRGLRRPAVLHVATHGIFAPLDAPPTTTRVSLLPLGDGFAMLQESERRRAPSSAMRCAGLALAGANHRTGGILTAYEMAGMDLRGTQLVVLSACETGLGTALRGGEFTGLRRALTIAGAAAHVTSLWRVSDAATRALVGHLYTLLREGVGRAEALQRAQARVASDPEHPQWAHPFYWASFTLSGAWGPMHDALRAAGADAELTDRGPRA